MSAKRVNEDGTEQNLPWFKFWPADWKQDPHLRKCSPATRGIWIDLICDMHNNSQSGETSGTIEQFARSQGCSDSEMKEAIVELAKTGTADIFILDDESMANDGKRVLLCSKPGWQIDSKSDTVIVRNRRMYKENSISRKRAISGRAGAEKRWNPDGKSIANRNGKSMANPLPLVSASTSVSTSSRPGKDRNGQVVPVPVQAGQAVAVRKEDDTIPF